MVSAILDENKSNMHDDNFPQRVKNAQRNTFVRRNFCMEGHFCMRVNKQKNNKSNKNWNKNKLIKKNLQSRVRQGCHTLRELREFRENQGIFKLKKTSGKLRETQGISGNFDLFFKFRETQGSFKIIKISKYFFCYI